MKDYYLILGVPRTATAAEIDAAFRRLAARYHPDVRPADQAAGALFKSAAEAHEVLSDAGKRRDYDRACASRPRRVAVSASGSRDVERATDARSSRPAGTVSRESGVHRDELRGALDVKAELGVVPEEAQRGGPVPLRISIPQRCSACNGAGRMCSACRGTGTVRTVRQMQLQLPPGLRDGTTLRIAAAGKAAPFGPDVGDLYLVIRVRPCC